MICFANFYSLSLYTKPYTASKVHILRKKIYVIEILLQKAKIKKTVDRNIIAS